MIDYIRFDYAGNKLIVFFADGSSTEYTQSQKDQYIIDFPDRESDVLAMGW